MPKPLELFALLIKQKNSLFTTPIVLGTFIFLYLWHYWISIEAELMTDTQVWHSLLDPLPKDIRLILKWREGGPGRGCNAYFPPVPRYVGKSNYNPVFTGHNSTDTRVNFFSACWAYLASLHKGWQTSLHLRVLIIPVPFSFLCNYNVSVNGGQMGPVVF